MKSHILAYAQTGFEGARWLRDEAELGGNFLPHLQNGSLREAGLIAVRNTLGVLPEFDIRNTLRNLTTDTVDVIGVGSEAVAVRSESGDVNKYLTGKAQDPELLAPRLQIYTDKAKAYLGNYLPETVVSTERVKLFKLLPPREYVRLQQPFVNVALVDPHRDADVLDAQPEIAEALHDFSEKLVSLFENEGLLMDVLNKGNLVWGTIGEEQNQLYLLDTIPIDYKEADFTGIKVPFWSPDMHLEYLADFLIANHSGNIFTQES